MFEKFEMYFVLLVSYLMLAYLKYEDPQSVTMINESRAPNEVAVMILSSKLPSNQLDLTDSRQVNPNFGDQHDYVN